MREGTTQPSQGEVSEDTDPKPERAKTRGHTTFEPSNALDATNNDPAHDLTVTDFSNLVRFSSAAIGCLSFSTPVSCEGPPEAFTDLLYTTPSRCIQASVSFAHNHGLTAPELLIGKPLAYLLPENRGFKEMLCEWRRRNLTREGFEWEVLDLQGHPTILHVALYGHLVGDSVVRLWIVTRDISALSRAIRNSGETEKHYRDLLNRGGLFFFRIYLDGTICFCTPSAQAILLIDPTHERPLEEILERACHPEDRSALEQLAFHRHSRALTELQVSLRLLSRNRGLLQVTLHQIPHVISGEIDSYDILGIEQGTPDSLTLHHTQKETLAACLAHDVNNQLTVASASIELAFKALGEHHPAVELLRTALHAVSQSGTINSQILHLSSGIQTNPSKIDLHELFQELIDECAAIIPDGIALSLRPSSTKLSAWADRTHTKQILLNLIINARDALGDLGTINLSATTKGVAAPTAELCDAPSICVSVSDNGPGIDAAVARTLFIPFVSTKSRGTPRGLGLAMVKTLVEENGGSISVTSARGIGTTFTFCLPIALGENKTGPSKRPFPSRSTPKQRLSVLIADDDPEVRHTLISALTSRGHQAVAIPNLHSLRNELSRTETPVDILLLDDGMADSPLEDLLKMTRNLHPETRVLITSGDPAAAKHVPPNRSTCLFLAKPFSLNDFYAAVESTAAVTE